MKVLCINTYGGSLLLGASAIPGVELQGSYEDSGFGTPIQKANFPELDDRGDILTFRSQWPTRDLTDTVVIAHPPCSAFSVQNNSPSARGVDSDAFACTKKVLDYAMGNKARAIAVESVMGALGGAWHVHQKYADENGYRIYRILQNGAMFGPQWRDRFWAVFVRPSDGDPVDMQLRLTPRWTTAGQAVEGHEEGPTYPVLNKSLDDLKEKLRTKAGCTDADLHHLFQEDHGWPTITDALRKLKFPKMSKWRVFNEYVGTFASSQLIFLDRDGLAGTLLGVTWWYSKGRSLSTTAYQRLMGFPASYTFPGKYANSARTFLSKGVIPQVATWVLEQVGQHINHLARDRRVGDETYEIVIAPNNIADFRFRKKQWPLAPALQDVNPLDPPRLKHYDDEEVA